MLLLRRRYAHTGVTHFNTQLTWLLRVVVVLFLYIDAAVAAAAAAAAAVVVGALDAFCYICRRDAEYHLQNTKEGKIKLEFF